MLRDENRRKYFTETKLKFIYSIRTKINYSNFIKNNNKIYKIKTYLALFIYIRII